MADITLDDIPNLNPKSNSQSMQSNSDISTGKSLTLADIPNLNPQSNASQEWKQSLIKNLASAGGPPVSALIGAYQNFQNLGTGAENLGKSAINSMFGTNLQKQAPVNIGQYAPNPGYEKAGEIGSSFLPIARGAKLLEMGADVAPTIASKVLPYVGAGAEGVGYGAAYTAADPNASNKDIKSNAEIAGIAGTTLKALTEGARAFITSKMTKPLNKTQKVAEEENSMGVPNPTATPQQAAVNLQIAKNASMKPTLGQITNSKSLNDQYEEASSLPGVNEKSSAGQFVGQVAKAGMDIVNNLMGGTDESQIKNTVFNHVAALKEANRQRSASDYKTIADIADQSGVPSTRETVMKVAQDTLDQYNKDTASGHLTPLENSPNIVSLMKTLSSPVTDESGDNPYTWSKIKTERTLVGEIQREFAANNPYNHSVNEILDNIYDAYSEDMGKSIAKSNSPELKSMWSAANQFHRDNNLPFRKGNLPNILRSSDNSAKLIPELLNNPDSLAALKLLDPKTRKLILASKLVDKAKEVRTEINPETNQPETRSIVSPAEMASASASLNPNKSQNLAALTDGLTHQGMPIQVALTKLNVLNKMARPIQKIAETPPTGYFAKAAVNSKTHAVIGALLAHAMGAGVVGDIGGAAAGTGYGAFKGKILTNYLKNPKIQQAYINEINRKQIIDSMIPKIPQNVYNPMGIANLLKRPNGQNQGNQ